MNAFARVAGRGISLGLVALLGTSAASAATVATFSDPAADGSTPLFSVSGGNLSGGWAATGLTLEVPIAGMSFSDAVFTMAPVVVNPDDSLGAGTVLFYEDAGMTNLILQIDFDSGTLIEPFEFGASFVSAENVTFSGPVITGPLEDEQFAFSFANPTTDVNGNHYTASFTSSAIPEPTTLALVGVGALGLLRRRN